MKFSSFLLASGLFLMFTACQKEKKPNVVLIMVDDMGYECLGVNGSLEYETPNLDKLANEGVRFDLCISQPLCTPSRVKIMTGLRNHRNYEYFGYLNPNQKTFGNLMKEAGYATCVVGKWQLNGLYHDLEGNQDNTRPYHFGFDEYCLWQLTKGRNEGERFANPLIEQNGERLEPGKDAYGPDLFADYAIDFIKRNQDKPFFVYYPMVLVHEPFVPTPDSKAWENSDRRYEKDTTYFTDMVKYMDKINGRIFNTLETLGLKDNTIVIFTADNGTHPSIISETTWGTIQGGKAKTINAGTHVPLIISWPDKIKRPFVYHKLVDFADFYPTLADIVGIQVETDGKSILPVLSNPSYTVKETVVMHYDPEWYNTSLFRNQFARDQFYKLYINDSLFFLPDDPLEQDALIKLTDKQLKIKEKLKKAISVLPEWTSE